MSGKVKMQKGDEVLDVWMVDAKALMNQGWTPVDDNTPLSVPKKVETKQQRRRKARTVKKDD